MANNSPAVRVLIVDDEPLIRWSLAETLIAHGIEVIEAGDGAEALEALGAVGALGAPGALGALGTPGTLTAASEAVDVVLLDYRLPDSDDLRLLATVRRVTPRSQVILMTAYGTPEVTKGALALGAYGVVNKPFDMDYLGPLVRQACTARTK